jgi:DNA invertase Pin-like site-specific DNA recombinase
MRTAIYVRVSTNRQTLAQTIEQQLERLQKHLELQGEPRLTENVFRDDGYSGANLNRPGLDRLRDRVKDGTLDRVVITSPDRLARNYVHQMLLVEEWERCGCQVEFLDRPMSQDPHDQLLLQIRGAVAEYERVLIAERMRRGRQMKLKAGALLPWTVPPYGYRSAPDRPRDPAGVQIEPAEGAIAGVVCTILGGQGHPAELGEIPVAVGPCITSWESALECRFVTWLAHQPGLHRQAVYWSKSRAARTHPAIRHPSVGKSVPWTGSHAGRSVDPGGHGTGLG